MRWPKYEPRPGGRSTSRGALKKPKTNVDSKTKNRGRASRVKITVFCATLLRYSFALTFCVKGFAPFSRRTRFVQGATHMLLWQHKQLHTEPTNEHDVNAIEASHTAGKRGRLLYDIRTVFTKMIGTNMSARFARAVVPNGIARAPREATSGMY